MESKDFGEPGDFMASWIGVDRGASVSKNLSWGLCPLSCGKVKISFLHTGLRNMSIF
jgi:hypothetical protein